MGTDGRAGAPIIEKASPGPAKYSNSDPFNIGTLQTNLRKVKRTRIPFGVSNDE